ncbi:MAG: hypothetical protein IMF05_03710, partial [Proteobacteria bacterium]|nr:hypothetical protein [Pseudomonadota bacterium]
GHPGLAFKFHAPGYLRRLLPGYELANHETGLLPGHADLSTNKVAAYDVLNNLCHANAGIPCCDYTLINNAATPGTGNGLFLRDGTPNPSGRALRDMVAPFVQANMREAWSMIDVGPRVFASQAGELVVASAPEPAAQNIQKAFNQAILGRETQRAAWGVEHSDVFNWASGAGARPDAPPIELRDVDLDRLKIIYNDTTAMTGRVKTHISLPFSPGSVTILGEEFYDSAPAEMTWSGPQLTVTHDAYTALRLKVS